MKRLMTLFITGVLLIGTTNYVIANDNNDIISSKTISEDKYIYIEGCNVDIKNNGVKELTEYLENELDLGKYSIKFEKIIPADLKGEKYWIQYNIYILSSKTPYSVWVCYEKGSLSYSADLNNENNNFILSYGEDFISNTFEFENMKSKFSGISFDDSKLDYQRISLKYDKNLIPCFNIMNSYSSEKSSGSFVLTMRYVCNKNIFHEYNDMRDYITVNKKIKYDFKNNEFSDLEKYLSEKLPIFKESNFQLSYYFPAVSDMCFIDVGKRTYAKMIPQNSYLIYELKIGEYTTPYRIEVMIDKSGKTQYRYNFDEENIKSILENEFIKNIEIKESEEKEAVLECENTAKSYFEGKKYEKASQKIVKGVDSEFRPYIDTEILYEKKDFKNDDKLVVSQRYYVTLI